MVPADIAVVSRLDSECFTTAWSEDSYAGELRHNNAHYYVAEHQGSVIGFAGMWLIFDEVTVNRLAVCHSYRRQGVGWLLLNHLIDDAVHLGATAATLEVRTTNTLALKLYEKLGFVSEGIRKGYYDDNGEDALIMWNRNLTAT